MMRTGPSVNPLVPWSLMKICISGPAAAFEAGADNEITSVDALKKLNGVKSDDSCLEYLDDEELEEIGLIGGHLEFVYDDATNRLRIWTIYHSPRKLKKNELARLVDETCGQWSDGIGENGICKPGENTEITLWPTDCNNVRVEQIDDGVVVRKPRKSPLFAAAEKNEVAKIAKLLDAGEDVDTRDKYGLTPLLYAVNANQIDAVRLLIERGAQVDVTEKEGTTALVNAATSGFSQVVEVLLKAGANPDFCAPTDYAQHYPLHMACNRGHLDAVRVLVEHGANVNLACNSGDTPLMHLKEDDVEIARYLVAHGANPEFRNAINKGMNESLKKAISQ